MVGNVGIAGELTLFGMKIGVHAKSRRRKDKNLASWRENNEKGIMKTQNTFYSRNGKRWFDLLLTIPGFVVISSALLMIALLIKSRLGSPVLFRQFLREGIAAAGGGR